jgi:uncharacterized protein YqeY
MSYGRVVHEAAASRRDAASQLTTAQRESQARTIRAAAMLEEHWPEVVVDDRVDDWAVWAVMDLWARGGEGQATLGQVKALYWERRRELIERLGWDPWTTDGPD